MYFYIFDQPFNYSAGPKLKKLVTGEEFKGQKLTGNLRSFDSARGKLIDLLLQNLDKRFDADDDVIKATSLSVLSKWPIRMRDEPG